MKKSSLFIGLAIIGVVGVLFWLSRSSGGGTELKPFAQCLKDKGAIFYGAFWCPHCQKQKKLFGQAANDLPYVECSTPDSSGQTIECTKKGIKSYPTWMFADGSVQASEMSLRQLSEKTGCELPQPAK